ncbi:MAG: tRNA (adenosine(37)-N6)-threonylcarbamoyltransferase complex dimerization subunit type 1 TsaB [Parvibaculaceae bacterium]
MTLLAIDTAQGALSVALVRGGDILARHFELRTRGHAEELTGLIARLLDEARLTPADLSALAVTVGPGTFTGLRVGLATARGFALARGLPLVGVTTLEAIAYPVTANPDEVIAASFDARRDELYLQAFDAGYGPLTEPLLVNVDDAAKHFTGTSFVLVGTGSDLLAEKLDASGAKIRLSDAPAQPDALTVARIAQARLETVGPAAFVKAPEPLYLRAPDAKLPGGLDPVFA